MPFVTSERLLLDAQEKGYAVGAFNIENMEMMKAVLEAAEETRSPVLLQTTPSTVRYGGLAVYAAMAAAMAKETDIPVCLHLDHGDSERLALDALEAGYTSVMIDGSKLPLEENIALARRVVGAAKGRGVPVEAELGKVGGKEDDLEAESDGYTDVDDAVRFVRETGVQSLAVAIGTAHGFYAGTPVLDKERLSAIRAKVEIPLVLHGASGLSDEDVRDCVRRGICKVNFATELRVAYTRAVQKLLLDKPDTFDPKKLGIVGMNAVKEQVKNRMSVCGCCGRA